MFYAQREQLILQELQLNSIVDVNELSRSLSVSVDTIRRDLRQMENSGLVKCVRGGACLPESKSAISNFKGREIIHSDLKRAAARKALREIHGGDVIAMNSGTTNTILAQELLSFSEPLTVVTNNLAAAVILMQNPGINLILIGGMTDGQEQSTCGAECVRAFGEYYPDTAFLSINAVSNRDGYTDFRMHEIPVIQTLASRAKRVIAVMDSSKLGKCSKRKVLNSSEVDLLLMDDNVPDDIAAAYHDKGFEIG